MARTRKVPLKLNQLPDDMLKQIVRFLPPHQLFGLDKVNKKWAAIAQADFIWKEKLKRYYPEKFKEIEKSNLCHSNQNDLASTPKRRKIEEKIESISWLNHFKAANHIRHYQSNPLTDSNLLRCLHEIILENDIENFELKINENQLTLYDLVESYNDETIIYLASRIGSQEFLDTVFKFVEQEYTKKMRISGIMVDTISYGNYPRYDICLDKCHHRLLEWAIICRQDQILENLMKNSSNMARFAAMYDPFQIAVITHNPKVIPLLFKYSYSPQHNQSSPIRLAVSKNNLLMARLILQYFPQMLTIHAVKSVYLVEIAIKNDNYDLVRLLLENKANIFEYSLVENIPLNKACRLGNLSIVKLLLEYGAGNDDNFRLNAMRQAIEYDHLNVVIELMKIKTLSSEDLFKILQYSVHCKAFTTFQYLINLNKVNNDQIVILLKVIFNQDNLTFLRVILSYLTPNRINDFYGNDQLIHLMCSYDAPDCLQEIIANGVNVNAPSKSGYTPLMIAISKNQIDMIRVLISANATFNCVKGAGGKTPLHFAAHSVEVTDMLFKAGANPMIKDNEGRLPIEIAAVENESNVVRYWLSKGIDVSTICFDNRAEILFEIKFLIRLKQYEDNRCNTTCSFFASSSESLLAKFLCNELDIGMDLQMILKNHKINDTCLNDLVNEFNQISINIDSSSFDQTLNM